MLSRASHEHKLRFLVHIWNDCINVHGAVVGMICLLHVQLSETFVASCTERMAGKSGRIQAESGAMC